MTHDPKLIEAVAKAMWPVYWNPDPSHDLAFAESREEARNCARLAIEAYEEYHRPQRIIGPHDKVEKL